MKPGATPSTGSERRHRQALVRPFIDADADGDFYDFLVAFTKF